MDVRQRRAHVRLPAPELLLESHHAEGGWGFDRDPLGHRRRGVECVGVLAWRDGSERADRQTGRKTPGDLRGSSDSGVTPASRRSRLMQCLAAARADAPAVEPARTPDEALTATGQQLVALDEKWAALVEDRLEGGEVHDRRVGLDLAEIRVDRGVERQIRSEPVLEVTADASTDLVVEWIGPDSRSRGR